MMRFSNKNYFIAVLFFAFASIACTKDDTKDDDCTNVVITKEKLRSPQWLVHVMDSFENNAVTFNEDVVYDVQYREF